MKDKTMPRVSRFSPNWSDPEILEAITVARENLIAEAVEAVEVSALTKNKHHHLFVGSRGSGKTHLITLVHHRIKKKKALANKLRIAWLNEDETSDTLLSLLLRIHRALAKAYPSEFPSESAEPIYDLTDRNEATEGITELLLKQLKKKTLLLLIENLDELFQNFGEGEQKAWRALIQNHPRFCTVATAQRLFRGISKQDSPFFGFFQVESLKPFSVDDAVKLISKIADTKNDHELEQFVVSMRGWARIRALHHLTGGNQRLFIILSEFINRESLEALVAPFEELVDEQLTPYYQERLRWLPTLQRRIVEFLCSVGKPEAVKTIARRLFSTSQSVSKQLEELRKKGYLTSRKRGRESMYELSEPLMRLSYQVKETKGRAPLRLLVDFLRVWYDKEELSRRVGSAPAEALITKLYFNEALTLTEKEGSLRLKIFEEEAEAIDLKNCNDDELALLRDLMEESKLPKDILRYGLAQGLKGNTEEAFKALSLVIESKQATKLELSHCSFLRAAINKERKEYKAAIIDYTKVIDLKKLPTNITAETLIERGSINEEIGEQEAAIDDYTKVLTLKDIPAELIADALTRRGVIYGQLDKQKEEIADYTQAIELKDAPSQQIAKALFNRGVTYGQIGKSENVITDLRAAIDLNEEKGITQLAHFWLGLTLMSKNNWEDAFNHIQQGYSIGQSKKIYDLVPTDFYLTAALVSGQSIESWKPKTDQLVSLSAKYNALTFLGAGLTHNLTNLKDSPLSPEGLSSWHRLWEDYSKEYPELELPARLLKTAIQYFSSKEDESTLLDLPDEERRILEQALGLTTPEK